MDIKGLWNFGKRMTVDAINVLLASDDADSLNDITYTAGPNSGEILIHNGSVWRNQPMPDSGIAGVVAEAESEGSSGTTGSTWLQKVSVNHTFESGKAYMIFWNFEWQNTSTSGDFDGRVQRNNIASSVMDMREEPADGGSDQWMPRSGWRYLDGLTGSQTFDLDYRNNGSGTANIRKARLAIMEVG